MPPLEAPNFEKRYLQEHHRAFFAFPLYGLSSAQKWLDSVNRQRCLGRNLKKSLAAPLLAQNEMGTTWCKAFSWVLVQGLHWGISVSWEVEKRNRARAQDDCRHLLGYVALILWRPGRSEIFWSRKEQEYRVFFTFLLDNNCVANYAHFLPTQ